MSSTPESAIPRTADDVRRDPHVGDVVRAVPSEQHPLREHAIIYAVRVEAVIGNVVATTDGLNATIAWKLRAAWCKSHPWVKEWEVLHIAGEQL